MVITVFVIQIFLVHVPCSKCPFICSTVLPIFVQLFLNIFLIMLLPQNSLSQEALFLILRTLCSLPFSALSPLTCQSASSPRTPPPAHLSVAQVLLNLSSPGCPLPWLFSKLPNFCSACPAHLPHHTLVRSPTIFHQKSCSLGISLLYLSLMVIAKPVGGHSKNQDICLFIRSCLRFLTYCTQKLAILLKCGWHVFPCGYLSVKKLVVPCVLSSNGRISFFSPPPCTPDASFMCHS